MIWDVTAFFYRKCISLQCEEFCENVIEMATTLLFEANGGEVFNIVRSLFVAQYQSEILELHQAMESNYCYKLKDMKVTLMIESIPLVDEEAKDSFVGIDIEQSPLFEADGESKQTMTKFLSEDFNRDFRYSELVSSPADADHITCLMFKESILKIQQSFKNIKDPKRLMDAFITI